MTNQVQLDNFIEKLSAQTGDEGTKVLSWFEAFARLDKALAWPDWTVVLLDEVSWMGRYDADFPAKLKSAWDTMLKRHDKLIVVICGSVSTWIKKNILENTGFAGRFSRDIVVGELPVSLCKAFWGETAVRLAPSEIIDVLSVTGGIPRYLEEVNPSLSANENIKRMCFSRDGVLFGDFKAIFSQVFGEESVLKRRVLEALVDGPRTCIEVAEAMGVERGGSLSETLEVLVDAGFVSKDEGYNPETGKKARTVKYRLSDNYTRFYLKYVLPHEVEILSDTYVFDTLDVLPGWDAVLGLQFENLVVNNFRELVKPLHLEGIPVLSAVPYEKRAPKGSDPKVGLQIDLLVQTRKSLYVVGVKRKRRIGESIESEVAEKVSRLRHPRGMSIRTALVYAGELAPVVRGNGYFDAIIPFSRLLGL
ncbi:MAG: ATPase [Kiritimatiellae bacterium]|nr:ATPase [Kiritimatiellia bacterium]